MQQKLLVEDTMHEWKDISNITLHKQVNSWKEQFTELIIINPYGRNKWPNLQYHDLSYTPTTEIPILMYVFSYNY